MDRIFITLLCDAYDEEEVRGEKRVVLHLHPVMEEHFRSAGHHGLVVQDNRQQFGGLGQFLEIEIGPQCSVEGRRILMIVVPFGLREPFRRPHLDQVLHFSQFPLLRSRAIRSGRGQKTAWVGLR